MTDKLTFETAVEFWRRHHKADPDLVWDRFINAEAFILDHRPRTSLEADVIFEILLAQGSDGRGDGRDRRALQRLRTYVRGLDQSLAVAAQGRYIEACTSGSTEPCQLSGHGSALRNLLGSMEFGQALL